MSIIKIEDVDFSRIEDKEYRLDTFYQIIDKDKNSVRFIMNDVQRSVHRNRHKRNLVIKARQLGMSTFWILDLMDDAIWHDNTSCGIVSYSKEHSSHIFKKIIGYALKNLPSWLNVRVISQSATEVSFSNNSVIRVDTTLRGSAYQNVLVSEFGKTCARNPIKAEEVVTGTLETIPESGKVTIESTGEGSGGFFYDMVVSTAERGNNSLTNLDYKLFFFPWYQQREYRIPQSQDYDVNTKDYFARIEKENNITLEKEQKNWYIVKRQILNEKMQQEYPSTITECFLSNSEAFYFAEAIKKAKEENRFVYNSIYDPVEPVYVAMDIGVDDLTVMIFFQVIHGEIRIFDYYEDNNKGVDFYAQFLLKDKPLHYHTIFLPHDAVERSKLDVTKDYASEFRKLFSGVGTKFVVMKKVAFDVSISNARSKIGRMVFNMARVKDLVDHCMKHRKKWSEQLGRYLDSEFHDINSHYGAALRYTGQAVGLIEKGLSLDGAYLKHRQAVESRSYQI